MTDEAKPKSAVTVTKTVRGEWVFVIRHRGVTYPAQGAFGSMLQAQAAGINALKSLQPAK